MLDDHPKPRRPTRPLATDADMGAYLDRTYGPGAWAYDERADVWVVPDRTHAGPGRRFTILERNGRWRPVLLHPEVLQ